MSKKAILDLAIPNFFDDPRRMMSVDGPYTLRQAMQKFENAVESTKKVVSIMQKDNFDAYTCKVVLDTYYAGEISDSNVDFYPSANDNYYYTLGMPELLDVEYAFEILDITTGLTYQKANKLKQELWQVLPDFYKGHTNPKLKPLFYDPKKPYPLVCMAGSLVKAHEDKAYFSYRAINAKEELEKYLPDDNAKTTTIGFNAEDVEIDGAAAPTLIHWTAIHPYKDMLNFAESVISSCQPAWLGIEPEGPIINFYAVAAKSAEDIKLGIYWEPTRTMRSQGYETIISAIINRRQLAQCFIKECEEAVKIFDCINEENTKKEYQAENRSYYADIWEQLITNLKLLL